MNREPGSLSPARLRLAGTFLTAAVTAALVARQSAAFTGTLILHSFSPPSVTASRHPQKLTSSQVRSTGIPSRSSSARVLHIHRTLSKALKQATDDGLIPRNAAALVKPPRPRRVEIRPLNRDQVRALFDTAREDRLEALYIAAVTAGLRRGELQGLKWEDLDLEAGTLQVRRTLSEPCGGHIFEAPKSGKGRNIRLTQRARTALREHRKRQLKERMRLGTFWQENGLVFPSSVGTPLSGGNLNRLQGPAQTRRAPSELPLSRPAPRFY
jgi:integrase